MSSSSKAELASPERLPLTGADGFLRAFDDEIRRRCGASHVSQLVLRLGQGFDTDAFRELIGRVSRAQPILHAPIRRPGGLGAPIYDLRAASRTPLPVVEVHEPGPRDPERVAALCAARMNQPFDGRRGQLLRFDVLPYDDGTSELVMSWLHMLFDGAGSEAFVEWLEAVHQERRLPSDAPADLPPEPTGAPLGARERGQRATRWQRHLASLTDPPIHSLAGPVRSVRQRLRYTVDTLDRGESERITKIAAERAGFLTPMLHYLAASIRAHDEVFRMRGTDPGGYLVPLPVNRRPKGGDPSPFRTHVSLLWFRVEPELARDGKALIEALKKQRRESIRDGLVEDGHYAMDYARFAPKRLYAHMARRDLAGELCSFFFAFTGEFVAGTDTLCGAPIRAGFHAAPVPPSPGSSTALSHHRGRLSLTHVYQEGALAPEEQEVLRETLLRALAEPD
ncbi:MAG: hypothetical protein QNK05_08975 [Myxococcota bacterium]|nr:hypothetical protein [Myxococcota bacterium]